MTTAVQQYTLGYLPTDVSFNLAILMDENRSYFLVSAHLSSQDNNRYSSSQQSSPTSMIAMTEVHLDLEQTVLKDKKIRDEDLMSKEERETSPCYSIKSLWGIPKQF